MNHSDETQEATQTDYLDEIEIELGKNRTAKVEIFKKHIGLEFEKESTSLLDDNQYLYFALSKNQAKSLANLLKVALEIQSKG
jgi:hypothetical protein